MEPPDHYRIVLANRPKEYPSNGSSLSSAEYVPAGFFLLTGAAIA